MAEVEAKRGLRRTGQGFERWLHLGLLLVLCIFCVSGWVSHPRYVHYGPAYLAGTAATAGYWPDSVGWESVACYIHTHILGQPPHSDWPPVPAFEDLPGERLLRPVYPALGALGLTLWPRDDVFRAISIFSFFAAVLLIYAIGMELGLGGGDSLIAAALFAVGTTPIRSSLQALADTTGLAFLLLGLCVSLALRHRLGAALPRAAVAAVLLLAFLASPMSLVVIPILVMVCRGEPARLRGAVIASVSALALYLAYCLFLDYSPVTMWNLGERMAVKWNGLDPDMSWTRFYAMALGRTIHHTVSLFLRPYGVLIVLAVMFFLWDSGRASSLRIVAVPWLVLSLFLLFLWGMRFAGLGHDRFFIYSVAPVCLLAAGGLRLIRQRVAGPSWQGGSSAAAALVLIAVSPHFHPGLVLASRPLWVWILAAGSVFSALLSWHFFGSASRTQTESTPSE